jgi:tetratricopeptide (TPR) repeat protein
MAEIAEPRVALAEVAAAIRRGLDAGQLDMAKAASAQLDEYRPRDAIEMKQSFELLCAVGRKVQAEIALETYLQFHHRDKYTLLLLAEVCVENQRSCEPIVAQLKMWDIGQCKLQDRIRLAQVFRGTYHFPEAIRTYRAAIDLDPKSSSAHHGLVETLMRVTEESAGSGFFWQDEAKDLRKATKALLRVVPAEQINWTIVGAAAIAAKDRALFRAGVSELEKRAASGVSYSRYLLLRGYNLCRQHDKAVAALQALDIPSIDAVAQLIVIMDLCGEYRMRHLEIQAANRILIVGTRNANLIHRCRSLLPGG